ncbi:hypothetical protein PTTG_00852 [Puccinia triticina 1-1 BBBD Race 1]|uniref:Uncharacterized protein n=2 Tax=Puccinia triticina TaxID=208348 RepID=A0A0C4EJD4_PUCT1|nr:uncharacterized protein PtA15_3A601 [Puccinia triticina]OAV93533.1 hypothetical protein PTTG_00852 [Puccinia triticina 1-1 BBBD Race 1]WAQ83232.1 hypothetical protein PtA15_3A601 [Puccinia triticina]WAR54081.1 hypothetical protein PtB15_3B591 [Puccinia triticina]
MTPTPSEASSPSCPAPAPDASPSPHLRGAIADALSNDIRPSPMRAQKAAPRRAVANSSLPASRQAILASEEEKVHFKRAVALQPFVFTPVNRDLAPSSRRKPVPYPKANPIRISVTDDLLANPFMPASKVFAIHKWRVQVHLQDDGIPKAARPSN